MIFYRATTDRNKIDCTDHLVNLFAGTEPTACWIVGAGPSLLGLTEEQRRKIADTAAGKFAVNYAGRGKDGDGWLVRPTLWTTFDPTGSFSPSIFLDPAVMKFVKGGKEMDLLPYGNEKLCDCPNLYFIRNEFKQYENFFGDGPINHSLDSLLQAIDIAIRLGFRRLYLLGCEMRIAPSKAQIEYIRSLGIEYNEANFETKVVKKNEEGAVVDSYRSDLFADALEMMAPHFEGRNIHEKRNKAREKLEQVEREKQYSFDETKSVHAAISSDKHYWDRVQYLRLARRKLSTLGVQLVSCTADSRLNTFFPFQTVDQVADDLLYRFGDPTKESTVGKYSTRNHQADLPFHRDLDPYGKGQEKKPAKKKEVPPPVPPSPNQMPQLTPAQRAKLQADVTEMIRKQVEIKEDQA